MENAVDLTQQYWRQNLERRQKQGDIAPVHERAHFWESPPAIRLYRDLYRTSDDDAAVRASHLLLSDSGVGKRKRAVSFGSGVGHKEIAMVRRGMVEHFTLVEIVPELMEQAKVLAVNAGVSDRISTVSAGYQDFCDNNVGTFDLVYWDNALHHMSTTEDAIRKSAEVLEEGGVFLMDDFVGPTYNQFPETVYGFADKIRAAMPDDWFVGPDAIPRKLGRISREAYLNSDPSEAADSGDILPSIAKHLLGAKIIPMGGLYYYLALRGAFGKFYDDDPNHAAIMRQAFISERILRSARPDLTMYALAFWRKGEVKIAKKVSDWRELIPAYFRQIS